MNFEETKSYRFIHDKYHSLALDIRDLSEEIEISERNGKATFIFKSIRSCERILPKLLSFKKKFEEETKMRMYVVPIVSRCYNCAHIEREKGRPKLSYVYSLYKFDKVKLGRCGLHKKPVSLYYDSFPCNNYIPVSHAKIRKSTTEIIAKAENLAKTVREEIGKFFDQIALKNEAEKIPEGFSRMLHYGSEHLRGETFEFKITAGMPMPAINLNSNVSPLECSEA